MDIHEKIRKLLHDAGMNPSQVAKQLGLKQPSVFSWCNGDSKPSKESIMKLSKLFNVDPAYLMIDSAAENGKKMAPLFEWVQAGSWTDFCQYSPDDVTFIELPYGVPENCFAVRVRGHSMTRMQGTSICEGSIVFCEPITDIMTPEELDGEVVIAQYQNAATIKQFIHDSPDFLVPWNPDPGYKRIPITDEIKPDLRIIGIVRASLLKL